MKKRVLTGSLVCLLGLMVLPGALYADFRWVDHNGNTRQTKFPPKPHQVKEYLDNEPAQEKDAPRVDLYVTSWCPYCHKAQAFFAARNIAVSLYDIEKDPRAAARKQQLDPRQGVPFAVVNGQAIHGYAPERYEQALQGR